MKLNLGCGFRTLPGWINVDAAAACDPDQLVDMERLPWPWPTDGANQVLLCHVLEHLGESRGRYLAIILELWRVCAPKPPRPVPGARDPAAAPNNGQQP